MKRLIRELEPLKNPTADKSSESSNIFSPQDLVDILLQIEELEATVAIRKYDGTLQLAINNVIYEIAESRDKNRYPHRRLRKLDS